MHAYKYCKYILKTLLNISRSRKICLIVRLIWEWTKRKIPINIILKISRHINRVFQRLDLFRYLSPNSARLAKTYTSSHCRHKHHVVIIINLIFLSSIGLALSFHQANTHERGFTVVNKVKGDTQAVTQTAVCCLARRASGNDSHIKYCQRRQRTRFWDAAKARLTVSALAYHTTLAAQ